MRIYLLKDGQKIGPLEEEAVRVGLLSGEYSETRTALIEGESDWIPLGSVFLVQQEPPPLPPPEVPEPSPTECGTIEVGLTISDPKHQAQSLHHAVVVPPPLPLQSSLLRRITEEFDARRPAFIFIFAMVSVFFLWQAVSAQNEISRISSQQSERKSQIEDEKVQIAKLKAEFDGLSQQQAALKAEYDNGSSWMSLFAPGVRSVFDGLTLGVFAEKGPMTESLKLEEWGKSIVIRDAGQREKARQLMQDQASLIDGANKHIHAYNALNKDHDLQEARRNRSILPMILFGLFALAASRTRPGEIISKAIYSVVRSFMPRRWLSDTSHRVPSLPDDHVGTPPHTICK